MSFARLILSTACNKPPTLLHDLALPDRKTATVLMEECLSRVLTFYPIVTSTALFGALEACYHQRGRCASDFDRWILHMGFAISFLCRSANKDDMHFKDGVHHMSKALEVQDSILQPGNLNSIQALLLLAVYSMLDPGHFSCWYLIGIASNLLVDMGAHHESSGLRSLRKWNPSERDARRRLFYCTYSLDRSVSPPLLRLEY